MSLQASTGIQFSNIPVAPPSPGGIQFAAEGLAVVGGDTVVLGSDSFGTAPQFTNDRFIDLNDNALRLIDTNIGGEITIDSAAIQMQTTDGFFQLITQAQSMVLQRTDVNGSFGPMFVLDNGVPNAANGGLTIWAVDSGGVFTDPPDGVTLFATTQQNGMRFYSNNNGTFGPANDFEFRGGSGDPFSPGPALLTMANPTVSDGSVSITFGLAVNGPFPLSDVIAWGTLDNITGGWILDDTIALPVNIAGNNYFLAFVRQP